MQQGAQRILKHGLGSNSAVSDFSGKRISKRPKLLTAAQQVIRSVTIAKKENFEAKLLITYERYLS